MTFASRVDLYCSCNRVISTGANDMRPLAEKAARAEIPTNLDLKLETRRNVF